MKHVERDKDGRTITYGMSKSVRVHGQSRLQGAEIRPRGCIGDD